MNVILRVQLTVYLPIYAFSFESPGNLIAREIHLLVRLLYSGVLPVTPRDAIPQTRVHRFTVSYSNQLLHSN